MASFWTILLIGISLSMDAFSLALIYGMIIERKVDKLKLSVIVGCYHFLMPIIGLYFGVLISNMGFINLKIVSSFILIWLGIDLIFSKNDTSNELVTSFLGFLLFGLSVSIDSLTVGIGLKVLTNNYIISSVIFSLCSFLFTYLGLSTGNVLLKRIGDYSTIVGGIILIIIAIVLFIK